ncbi:hypothetical protein O181_028204 [Austropuccinia psidii MF-1]|uniref:Uncharacterized protein n=1 Tax=Austropuccinia psidii MF-1 TaxID=1389203 RepID=A0A9Q3CNF3_9BASI|nr:hypothetical protein [Austropuccinia psidii MF-1]
MDHLSSHGLWYPPEATRSAQFKPYPQLKGDSSHSSMHPILKVAGVVHKWYYIPLCTIFAQQFNGDTFRTKFHDSKPRSQNSTPIPKKHSSAHQSGISWRVSKDYSRTPITWPCRSWVGSSIEDYLKREIYQGYYIISISFKGRKYFSIPWTIQSVHTGNTHVSCMALAQLGQFIPTVAIQSHSSFPKMARTVLAQFRQYRQ